MEIINFIITGNQTNIAGNPIPKLKMTGNQSWTPQAKKYVAWKEYVSAAFYDGLEEDKKKRHAKNIAEYGKPIRLVYSQCALMVLHVRWANETHGDPESIFGSIADAIFVNDKELDVVVFTKHSKDKTGEVDGSIFIFDDFYSKEEFIKTKWP